MTRMANESPVVTLVNVILLAAIKQGVETIRIRRASASECVVEFATGGGSREEVRPPTQLLGPIIRRLSVMASLPVYGKGMAAEGVIRLDIGDDRHAQFEIRVEGHGDASVAYLQAKQATKP